MDRKLRVGRETLIKVRQEQDNQAALVAFDSGIGLPPDLDSLVSKSLGLQLVTILVDQLDGTLDMCNNVGTQFNISIAA